jgi:glucose-1-phosphate adenylyltransferase
MIYGGKSVIAVELAGGKAERLWPLTGPYQSKATLRVAGKRLAYYNADRIEAAQLKHLIIPVEFNKKEIKRKLDFGNYGFDNVVFSEAKNEYFPSDIKPHFRGTADAVSQSEDLLKGFDYMLIVPCDHITNVDYGEFVEHAIFNHEKYGAVATLGAMIKPAEEIKVNFGNPEIDKNGKVIDWVEKPEKPISELASLGIYVGPVRDLLEAIRNSDGHDFGKNVMKHLIEKGKLYVHYYPGERYYWNDVGVHGLLMKANMDLLNEIENIKIPLERVKYRKTKLGGTIKNCLLSKAGPKIHGSAENSVLGDYSIIDLGVELRESILMSQNFLKNSRKTKPIEIKGSIIGKYSYVSDTSLDSSVIGRNVTLHKCRIRPGIKIDTDAEKYGKLIESDVRLRQNGF